jgi:ketosteroid isomerase-like protein
MESHAEIFSAAVDALNRVDMEGLERWVDPRVAFIPRRSAVTGAFIGHDGVREFLADNARRFDEFRAEFEELRPLPDGRLLSLGWIHVRGKGGHGQTRYRTAGIATFRDGKLASWRDYGTDEAAIEAAGYL